MTYDIYLFAAQKSVPKSKQNKTPLQVVVYHNNLRYKKCLGISIFPYTYVKGKCTDTKVNDALRSVRAYLEEELTEFLTPEQIQERLKEARLIALAGGDRKRARIEGKEQNEKKAEKNAASRRIPSFSDYLETWWPLGGTSNRQRKLFRNNMERFFGANINWDDVDETFRFRLEQKMNEANFSINYKRKTLGQLKSVMEEGRKLKYHTNLAYKDWQVQKEYIDTIYLTQEEVDKLWEADLPLSMERKARDLFIVGVYTVSRFSDYSRISDDVIQDETIHIIHKKTGTPVYVPVAPRVRTVLDRYGGTVPKISQQRFNDAIKEACRKAGIDSPVEYRHSRGKGFDIAIKKKYELVTSHTARRTGATLMRQNGASMRDIMLIGGWSDEQTLERYLRMKSAENAEKMRSNPFFQ